MSTGTWEPDAPGTAPDLDTSLLDRLASYAGPEQLGQLNQLLEPELAAIMKLDHALWSSAVENLPSEQVIQLIRVLTVAEQLPGWEAADKSPVIALAKSLRKRGEKLERELLLWIRENSENRYLPYGPL